MNKKKIYGGSTIKDIDKKLQERFWQFLISTVTVGTKEIVKKEIDKHVERNHPFYNSLPDRLNYYVATSRYSVAFPEDSIFMRWLMDEDSKLYRLVSEAKDDGCEFSIKL